MTTDLIAEETRANLHTYILVIYELGGRQTKRSLREKEYIIIK